MAFARIIDGSNGHQKGMTSEGLADTTKSRTKTTGSAEHRAQTLTEEYTVSQDRLTVIIDIDSKDQWKFPTVPGTWRRLTMNIFGNALKYTPAGFIKIKLEAHPIASEAGSKSRITQKTMVTLIVTDSGKGMTKVFMEKKMFMPFSQEDVIAPGTGLGMSMVKQIVDLSGDEIDIKSDLGIGTSIKLSLPLTNCPSPLKEIVLKPDPIEDAVQSVRRRAGGRTVSILGFDHLPGGSELQIDALTSLKLSMVKYASEWFGFKLVRRGEPADIARSDEFAYQNEAVSETRYGILLILCSSGARRDIFPSRLHTGQIAEFVSKPCGPHRLAKALLNCLDTEDGTPYTPIDDDRVSEKGLHIEAVSPKKVSVTAGTSSSSRLIGNLQSSIGFSPSVVNLIRTPSLSKTITLASLAEIASTTDTESAKTLDSVSLGAKPQTSTPQNALSPQPDIEMDSSEESTPTPSVNAPAAPRKPVMLLVEDNPVNMMLLATYMKKNKWEFEKASNGLLALEAFRERPGGFDVIFMDVSMPVMTGYESTRHIRMIETERRLAYEHQTLIQTQLPYLTTCNTTAVPPSSFPFDLSTPTPSRTAHSPSPSSTMSPKTIHPFPAPQTLSPTSPSAFDPSELNSRPEPPRLKLNSPTLIIALTGFSSQKDQEMAFEAGVDIFMTKPVRFHEVGRILEGWIKSREVEVKAAGLAYGGVQSEGRSVTEEQRQMGDQKRELDEDGAAA